MKRVCRKKSPCLNRGFCLVEKYILSNIMNIRLSTGVLIDILITIEINILRLNFLDTKGIFFRRD